MSENNKNHSIEYKCKACNKNYASQSSLCNHNKKFHNKNNKQIVIIEKPNIIAEPVIKKYNCRHCSNIYSTKQSRWRHEKLEKFL